MRHAHLRLNSFHTKSTPCFKNRSKRFVKLAAEWADAYGDFGADELERLFYYLVLTARDDRVL